MKKVLIHNLISFLPIISGLIKDDPIPPPLPGVRITMLGEDRTTMDDDTRITMN